MKRKLSPLAFAALLILAATIALAFPTHRKMKQPRCQYVLYSDAQVWHCMDTMTFEEYQIPRH